MKFTKLTAVSLFLVFVFAQFALAGDIYVSLSGNDANQGTQALPVASLAKAQSLARPFSGIEAVTVHVADGVYYLPETLVFELADSGSDEFPVVYAAENEGGAVLSGGTKLSLAWNRTAMESSWRKLPQDSSSTNSSSMGTASEWHAIRTMMPTK